MEKNNLERILPINMNIQVVIGRTEMPVSDILALAQGSVIPLDAANGDPLLVYANGTLIAKGEAVIVNEKYGVRITEVVSKGDR